MVAVRTYLTMGGYAAFVWPAYGVTLAVLGGLALWSWKRYRQAIGALDSLQSESLRRPPR